MDGYYVNGRRQPSHDNLIALGMELVERFSNSKYKNREKIVLWELDVMLMSIVHIRRLINDLLS